MNTKHTAAQPLDLDKLEAMLNDSTASTWVAVKHNWSNVGIYSGSRPVACLSIIDDATEETQETLEAEMDADAAFIVAACNALPALIAQARTARLDTTASASIDTPTIRTIVTKAREFYLGYLSRHIPGNDIDAVRAEVTTDTATRAIAFDLRATLAPTAAQQAAAAPSITREVRTLIEWAYDQGARFGDEVSAEAWFYEAEEAGSIAKRLTSIASGTAKTAPHAVGAADGFGPTKDGCCGFTVTERCKGCPYEKAATKAPECEACNGDGYYEHKGSDTECRVCGGGGVVKAPVALLNEIADLRAQLAATTENLQTAVQQAWRANAALTAQLAQQGQSDDYTVDDSELARKIMVFLGRSTTQSMEPGADPLRDRLAAKIASWRPAAPASAQPADPRLEAFIDWYLREGKRAEIHPTGHVERTTREHVLAWLDAKAGAQPDQRESE